MTNFGLGLTLNSNPLQLYYKGRSNVNCDFISAFNFRRRYENSKPYSKHSGKPPMEEGKGDDEGP